jgi:hypothetical protein
VHHGIRTPVSVAAATAGLAEQTRATNGATPTAATAEPDDNEPDDVGPLLVREKVHAAEAMTLDQALFEMELVGHDFFLFVDAEKGSPSVVYRRRGYDYGVIRLVTTGGATA